jgi:hypothetical protein
MSHKYRKDARKDANENQIVKDLKKLGYSVQIDHDDILVGTRGINFWYELKDERALDKNGNIRESEIKPSQKKLRDTWNGHYKIVSSLDQILDDMREVFQRLGL